MLWIKSPWISSGFVIGVIGDIGNGNSPHNIGTNWINGTSLAGGTSENESLTAVGGETVFVLAKAIGLSYKYQIFRNGQLQAETNIA